MMKTKLFSLKETSKCNLFCNNNGLPDVNASKSYYNFCEFICFSVFPCSCIVSIISKMLTSLLIIKMNLFCRIWSKVKMFAVTIYTLTPHSNIFALPNTLSMCILSTISLHLFKFYHPLVTKLTD